MSTINIVHCDKLFIQIKKIFLVYVVPPLISYEDFTTIRSTVPETLPFYVPVDVTRKGTVSSKSNDHSMETFVKYEGVRRKIGHLRF